MIPQNYDPLKYPVIEHWQKIAKEHKGKTIPYHRSLTKKFMEIEKARLMEHELSELIEAVDNYHCVLKNPNEYWYKYKQGFTAFFRPGIQKDPPFYKFLEENDPLNNLANKVKSFADAKKENETVSPFE